MLQERFVPFPVLHTQRSDMYDGKVVTMIAVVDNRSRCDDHVRAVTGEMFTVRNISLFVTQYKREYITPKPYY